jgi:hypothetical protein
MLISLSDKEKVMNKSYMKVLTAVLAGLLLVGAYLNSENRSLQSAENRPLQNPANQSAAPIPKGLPAPLSGFQDQATFLLFLNEERIGTMQSNWQSDGHFEARATLSLAGQSVETSLKITPDAEGRWKEIVSQSALGVMTITREGASARRTFKDKTTTFETRSGVVLFDNNSPALISQAVRQYDRIKGGAQKFPLLIVSGLGVNATLEAKEKVERSIGGRDLVLTKFVYGLPGVDLYVWVDDTGKLYLADAPAQKAAFVREGYEALRMAPETDALISTPKYEVEIQSNVSVPMRDGVKLAADIYRPAGVDKAPAILVRTPYKKEMSELQGRFYARRGYVFAIQDCRGRFSSTGVWEPFMNEAKDGYDAVEWLASQPFCNGKVGMIGASYLGWVQWWAASRHPPHLVTIIPNVSPPDPFYNVPYEYGVFFLWGAIWWADVVESNATADLSGAAMSKTMDRKFQKVLRSLPVVDLDKAVLGKENPYWRQWIAHPNNDSYWERSSFLDRLKDARIPVFHQSGWFDGDGIGTKLNYLKMASYKHPYQKLILGPWGHTDTASRRIGDRDFGPQAIVDLQRLYLRWFDYWLKGLDNGITKEPLVDLFVMGTNKWLHGETYPLANTQFRKLYLSSQGNANSAKGGGKLSWQLPPADAPADRYTYDPGDPTPDPGMYEESEESEKKVRSVEERKQEAEEYAQKLTETRQDILVYISDPLEKPLTFAGPISAVLHAASSAKDTDWFVSLMEVDEKGKMYGLGRGKIRARFRKSMKEPQLLKPGEIYQYTIDLWHTGITIPAGRRLRVEVASAAFPRFSRNLNTGGHNETETRYVSAQQAVYHDGQHASYILLPVIPE